MITFPSVSRAAGVLLVVLAGALVIPLMLPPSPAVAASVTVPITINVAEAGAPPFTWTISGPSCAAAPSSGTTGATVTITMNSGCSYSIVTPAGTATQRFRLTTGTGTYVTSLPETSCSSGTCAAVVDTAHVQELLTYGTSCNSAQVAPASPTGDKWYNYGTSVTVTCNGVWGRASGTGTRAISWNWDGGSNSTVATLSTFASSSMTMSSGHTFKVNVVTQYQLTLDPGATRALKSLTLPTITGDNYWYDTGTAVTYAGNGVFGRIAGAGNRSASWSLDSGSTALLSTAGTFTAAATMSSAHTIHVVVKTQYQVTLGSVATLTFNSITPPTLANDNYWYDSGTAVTVNVNGLGTRNLGTGTRVGFYSLNGGAAVPVASAGKIAPLNNFAIASPELVEVTLVTQYQLTLDAGATLAISSITPTPIAGDNYWYDAGTQVTYTGNGVYSRTSGAGFRVSSWWWDSGSSTSVKTIATFPSSITMNAPHLLHTTSVAQYQVSVTGNYAVASATSPTISGDGYWYDSGTSVSVSLQGVFGRSAGTGERVVSYSVNGGQSVPALTAGEVSALNSVSITAPITISTKTVTQYQLVLQGATASAVNSVTSPTVSGDTYWYDAGSSVRLTLNGIWARNGSVGERLTEYSVDGGVPASVATSGTVTVNLGQMLFPRTVTSTSATQFLLTVNGGAGVSYSVPPPISMDTGWYDSGTSLNVSARTAFGSNGTVRERVSSWNLDGGAPNQVGAVDVVTAAVVMNSPHTLSFDSVTQYLVTIVLKDSSGAMTLSPGAILVNVDGATQGASGGSVWVDAGSSIQIVSVNWKGVEVTPAQVPTYKVASPLSVTFPVRVFEATVVVKDLLGFPIGGAQYSVTLANKTSLHGTTSGDGTIPLGPVPLGTYIGSVSYLGVTTSFTGDATTGPTTSVIVSLSYSLIVLLIALVVVVVAVIYLRRRG